MDSKTKKNVMIIVVLLIMGLVIKSFIGADTSSLEDQVEDGSFAMNERKGR